MIKTYYWDITSYGVIVLGVFVGQIIHVPDMYHYIISFAFGGLVINSGWAILLRRYIKNHKGEVIQ